MAEQRSRRSRLYLEEDYWAIWLAFILIVAALALFLGNPPEGMRETIDEANARMAAEAARAPFKTVAWYEAHDAKGGVKSSKESFARKIKLWTGKPRGWKSNPVDAFFSGEEDARARSTSAAPAYDQMKRRTASALLAARNAEARAAAAGFGEETLNAEATRAIAAWRGARVGESATRKKAEVQPHFQIAWLIPFGLFLAIFFGIGMKFLGRSPGRFVLGFAFVFFVAVLAYFCEAQSSMKAYGIGYAAWAIGIGLLISNTVGTPKWVMPAVQTEYYIKTGLVLLGAEILFGKILTIGLPGIFVAWVVTPVVLVSTYIFGNKLLGMPSKTLNITIAAATSVCGVSAAIATASASRAKKEELTLAVGLSLIFTSLMMIFMPAFIKGVGMDDILGGAWMGGTIDATGAVAAAGAFLSDRALYVAATIKMIQNVLIGVIAFCVAVYWCARVEAVPGKKVGAMEIWYRFPKFVIGFVAVSFVFSVIWWMLGNDVSGVVIDNGVIRGFTKIFRGWFFCLAFVSIGLATNFRELAHHFKGGKPLILYVVGQGFNLIFTLLMAYLMFYLAFPEVLEKI